MVEQWVEKERKIYVIPRGEEQEFINWKARRLVMQKRVARVPEGIPRGIECPDGDAGQDGQGKDAPICAYSLTSLMLFHPDRISGNHDLRNQSNRVHAHLDARFPNYWGLFCAEM